MIDVFAQINAGYGIEGLPLPSQDFIRTSIHDEYDLMLFWHFFLSILRV
jgi:hypothetical protein